MAAGLLPASPWLTTTFRWLLCFFCHNVMLGLPEVRGHLGSVVLRLMTLAVAVAVFWLQCGYLADKYNRVILLFSVIVIGEAPCLGTYWVSHAGAIPCRSC
jgi:hypothetical protein